MTKPDDTDLDDYAVEPMATTQKHLGLCANSVRKLARAGDLDLVKILDRTMVTVASRRRLVAKGLVHHATLKKPGNSAGKRGANIGA